MLIRSFYWILSHLGVQLSYDWTIQQIKILKTPGNWVDTLDREEHQPRKANTDDVSLTRSDLVVSWTWCYLSMKIQDWSGTTQK